MAIRTHTIEIIVSGADGAAAGSAQSGVVNGRLVAIHIDHTDGAATADVTISTLGPVQPLLTVTNSAADAWYYPRVQIDTTAAVAVDAYYAAAAIDDHVTVTVAQSNAGSVIVTLLVADAR